MRNKKRIWKIIGTTLSIGTISCIITACVASCGSENNSANSSSTNSSNTSTSRYSWLGTTISGDNYQSANNNWNTSFNQMSNSVQYANWMKQNLTYYCENAPTYFQNMASKYYNDYPQTLSANQNDQNDQPTTDAYTSYLPCTYDINESYIGGGDGAPVFCLKLKSMSLNSCVYNSQNNSFNLEMTETFNSAFFINNDAYDDESDENNNMISSTLEYTDTITNAFFTPTLITNTSSAISNNALSLIYGGWYLSSCTSNNLELISENPPAGDEYLNNLASIGYAYNSDDDDYSEFNLTTNYDNPSSSSWISSPMCATIFNCLVCNYASMLYNSFNYDNYWFYECNYQSFNTNPWLTSIAGCGLVGFAINNNQLINANSISNYNEENPINGSFTGNPIELDEIIEESY